MAKKKRSSYRIGDRQPLQETMPPAVPQYIVSEASMAFWPYRIRNRQPLQETILKSVSDPVAFPIQNYISPDVPVPETAVAFWLGSKINSILRGRRSRQNL